MSFLESFSVIKSIYLEVKVSKINRDLLFFSSTVFVSGAIYPSSSCSYILHFCLQHRLCLPICLPVSICLPFTIPASPSLSISISVSGTAFLIFFLGLHHDRFHFHAVADSTQLFYSRRQSAYNAGCLLCSSFWRSHQSQSKHLLN